MSQTDIASRVVTAPLVRVSAVLPRSRSDRHLARRYA